MANGDDELYKQLNKSYDEIGVILDGQEPNMQDVMKKFLSTNRLIMAFFIGTFLDDHKKVETMWAAHKFMIFVSGAFGLSVIALIWTLITGQAVVTFVK